MNYLAHAYLSNNDPHLLVGNFIADHLRGNNFGTLSPQIIEGIHLHRRIDTFTDAHPLFKKSKRVFYEGFEKYSGILVDIYFDHLLAKNFDTFSKIPLLEFSQKVYNVYRQHEQILPIGSSRFLGYVMKNNIYTSYASPEGIKQVLYHLSQRINHPVRLDDSFDLFQQNLQELENNFDLFFKDIIPTFNMPAQGTPGEN